MITAIRIENLRSIRDSGFVQIKPLTILLGKNSSGKSTFLRSFPLFSQSINKSLRGPISWFDASSVDFGDYETAKNRYAKENERICFSVKIQQKSYGNIRFIYRYRFPASSYILLTQPFEVRLALNNDNKGTYISNIQISAASNNINISVDSRNAYVDIKIDGLDYSNILKCKWDFTTQHGILPSFIRTLNAEKDFNEEIFQEACDKLSQYCDKRLKKISRIANIFSSVHTLSKNDLLHAIQHSDIISLTHNTSHWTVENDKFLEIYYLWVVSGLPILFSMIDTELTFFYSSCGYIAPTRAEAARFYRNQELRVSDVDAYGKNLQEFISSLSSSQYNSYQEFTKQTLGVTVSVSNVTGHQSLQIEGPNGKFNLADVGFGYSQVLPIITKMWHITQIHKNRIPINLQERCVVIEQPELHLHPAMQARLADAFIYTIRECAKNKIDIRLIIETHSQAIVNRIGRRVSEAETGGNIISRDDINIVIFQKDIQDVNSQIITTQYKENGQISEWPYGFFDPED